MSVENLDRFLEAQKAIYQKAFKELKLGKKQSHWMWFIFPQLHSLGHSSMAQHYAINSLEEAKAYLNHNVLGERLHECTTTMLQHVGKPLIDILGFPDHLKFKSSMTLFNEVSSTKENIFSQAINNLCNSEKDQKTLVILQGFSK